MAVQTKVLDFDSKGLKRVKILLKSDNAGGTCVTNRVLFAKKEIHLNTVEADLCYPYDVNTILAATTISGTIFLVDIR